MQAGSIDPASDDARYETRLHAIVRRRSKVAIKKDVAAHPEDAATRTLTLAQQVRRFKANCRTAFANDQRGDGNLQAIEQVGLEKCRDGHAPTLDEDPRAAA